MPTYTQRDHLHTDARTPCSIRTRFFSFGLVFCETESKYSNAALSINLSVGENHGACMIAFRRHSISIFVTRVRCSCASSVSGLFEVFVRRARRCIFRSLLFAAAVIVFFFSLSRCCCAAFEQNGFYSVRVTATHNSMIWIRAQEIPRHLH